MQTNDIDRFVASVLQQVLARHGGQQILLFGPEAEPFWCAHQPITGTQLALLRSALDLIEEKAEAGTDKPFVASDSAGRFRIAALGSDSDLYVVCIDDDAERPPSEASVGAIRDEVAGELAHLRNKVLRFEAGYGR